MNLVEYGIYEEKTDYRAHVCFPDGGVYLYRTNDAVDLLSTACYPVKEAHQQGVDFATARGYIVPIPDIPGIRRFEIPGEWLAKLPVSRDSDTSAKGKAAMQVVKAMLKKGKIAFALNSNEVMDRQLQIEGADIIIDCHIRIQVKCDWMGGLSGSGELYIQTHECNPVGRH